MGKQEFLCAYAGLAAAVLLAHVTSALSSSFTRFLVILLLLVLVFSARSAKAPSFHRHIVTSLTIVAVFAILPENDALRLFVLALICFWVRKIVAQGSSQTATLCFALGLAVWAFAGLYTLQFVAPAFWLGAQHFSQFLSTLFGDITSQPLQLSVAASGFYISVLFLFCGISVFILSARRKWKALAAYFAGIILGQAIFLVSVHALAQWLQNFWLGSEHTGESHADHLHSAFTSLHPMNLLVVLLLLHAFPLYFFLRKRSFRPIHFSWRPVAGPGAVASAMCFLIGAGLLFLQTTSRPNSSRNILIHNKGYFNWEKPTFSSFGLRSSGMFGMLPSYLQATGYETRTDSTLNDSTLANLSVLMIINLHPKLSAAEKEAMQKFVQRGGALLVLGDHTGLGGIMEPLNDLLGFVNIRFKFDSAHYLKSKWREAFAFFPSPLFAAVKDEEDLGLSVGASLDFSPPHATPLLFARYGFSDWGEARNSQNAFLGDRAYNPGELLGDLALIVAAEYGQGKVLVFGDTSTFQNGVLPFTFPFTQDIFELLTGSTPGWMVKTRRYFGIFFLMLGLISLFAFAKPFAQPAAAMIAAAALAASLLAASFLNKKHSHVIAAKTSQAYIDAGHLNRFTHYGEEGIWALCYNLMRNDYLPFVHRRFSVPALKQSRIAFFMAPVRELSRQEIDALENYMQQGGAVIWSVGHEERHGSKNVLRRFGFDLDNVPLGPIPPKETKPSVQFYKAWPIVMQNGAKVDTLCTGWNYPVIVSKSIGSGKFILIADPGFLLSENLETEEGYSEVNVEFVRELLQGLKGRVGERETGR